LFSLSLRKNQGRCGGLAGLPTENGGERHLGDRLLLFKENRTQKDEAAPRETGQPE